MIIQNLTAYKSEFENILFEVFSEYYPDKDRAWFANEVKDVDLTISLGYLVDNKLVAIYLLQYQNHLYFNGQGLRGDALAVLPEYRGQKIFNQFLSFIMQNYQADYLWGTQGKELNNLSFWLKYRVLIGEDDKHYITGQKLNKREI